MTHDGSASFTLGTVTAISDQKCAARVVAAWNRLTTWLNLDAPTSAASLLPPACEAELTRGARSAREPGSGAEWWIEGVATAAPVTRTAQRPHPAPTPHTPLSTGALGPDVVWPDDSVRPLCTGTVG